MKSAKHDSPERILEERACEIGLTIDGFINQGKSIFATSSFQTHSIPLLHILSRCQKKVPVYFANTGFLFPETLQFQDQVSKQLNIEVREVGSNLPKIHQLNEDGNFLFTSDPDRCCFINKIEPVRRLMQSLDVWVNGVRRDQTETRKGMDRIQQGPDNCLRFHPMLDWSEAEIKLYSRMHQLPEHPLSEQGYESIGCQPCTRMIGGRDGRWSGLRKTECGLHTVLAAKRTKAK